MVNRLPAPHSTTRDRLCAAMAAAGRSALLASNKVGLGLTPVTPNARRFVDEPRRLHPQVAAVCASVAFMMAGVDVLVKRGGV